MTDLAVLTKTQLAVYAETNSRRTKDPCLIENMAYENLGIIGHGSASAHRSGIFLEGVRIDEVKDRFVDTG